MADNAQVIWNYFKNKKFTDCGIAGLMGNLQAESGLIPTNLQNTFEKKLGMTDAEYTAAVDSGKYTNFVRDGAGYGLAQWTYWSRKQNFLNFCKERGKSIGDLNTQLDFLYTELTTSFPQVVKILLSATSVQQASDIVLLQFEKPADQSLARQQQRGGYGQTFYDRFASKQVIIPTIGGISGMKYSDSNPPLVCMQTQSTCYKGTRVMEVKGILWHSTGANNPNLKRYVQPSDNAADKQKMLQLLGVNNNKNDWNHIERQAGLNCWIGKLADGTVTTVQTMPWNYRPWGCGSGPKGSCNNGWIQFEICEDGLTDQTYFNAAYKEACEITAYLCKKFNIDPHGKVNYNGISVPTILCHIDSNKLGLGSAHSDVLHWFPKFGKNMDTVRNDVAALLAGTGSVVIPQKPIEEDENMTQEKFNEHMNEYLKTLSNQPATFEQDALVWGQKNGLMVGNESGNLMPRKFMTRGEFMVVLKRFYDKFLKK